ncbi:hypothetical protein Q3G72_016043 [Acer saccharum]|nr:hypothetical protein Q3G72_016043 [Acer saccharum]
MGVYLLIYKVVYLLRIESQSRKRELFKSSQGIPAFPTERVEKAEFIGSLPAESMAKNSYFTIRLEKQLPSLRGNASEIVLERDWIAFSYTG